MNTICSLRDASKTYGSDVALVWALREVSLDFGAGEFAALSGPSGSGKTTALNLVGCLDTPSSGGVFIDGKDTSELSTAHLAKTRAQKIGFIFQSFNLVPVLTALENVELALQLSGSGFSRSVNKDLAAQALKDVGLGEMLGRRPSQLSGGQQQRVAIARALVKKPKLVIADEPTANLDSKTGEAILQLMCRLNEDNGTTFIFSTHDPMVLNYARRGVVLKDGVVAEDKTKSSGSEG